MQSVNSSDMLKLLQVIDSSLVIGQGLSVIFSFHLGGDSNAVSSIDRRAPSTLMFYSLNLLGQ
jgi:hypothetical protein